MRSLQNKRDRSTAQEVEIINIYGLEVAFPPNKKAKTERITTPSKTITGSTQRSSDSSNCQQCSEASGTKLPAIADFVKNMTEKAKKELEDTTKSPEAEYKLYTQSGFNDLPNG